MHHHHEAQYRITRAQFSISVCKVTHKLHKLSNTHSAVEACEMKHEHARSAWYWQLQHPSGQAQLCVKLCRCCSNTATLLITSWRLFDTKVSGIQLASDKGTDGGLKLARRDMRKLHSFKFNTAEF